MKKLIICTVCPRGCEITAEYTCREDAVITGFTCKRGEKYAYDECFAPKRVFTSSVRIDAAGRRMLPVRTLGPIDRDMLIPCARETASIRVHMPVRAGDVIRENFLGTGSDLIASMTLQEGSND